MCENEINDHYVSESIKYQRLLYSPLKRNGFLPENGSEVFVRQIPVEENECDLLDFFAAAGRVFQVRLMMNENGLTNRGFAYVTYFEASMAKTAVATLNAVHYKGRCLVIENSLNNCRLFIGGIPTYKRKDQVWQELYCKGIKNIIDVIMYRSYSDRAENRGFVFVEFKTHEEAAYFRAKYAKTLKLWDNAVVVDWSVPIPQVDDALMSTVKIIYLRNLDVCQTREDLQCIVLNFTSKPQIEKVYKFKNYAFIHLVTRECAEDLMEKLKDYFKDTLVEITWAKPPSKFTTQDYRHNRVSNLSSFSRCSPRHSLPKNTSHCTKCSCTCEEFKDASASGMTNSDSSPSPPPSYRMEDVAGGLTPYERFCRDFFKTPNAVQSSPMVCRNKVPDNNTLLSELDITQNMRYLRNSTSPDLAISDLAVPFNNILNISRASLSPEENFYTDLPRVANTVQSSPDFSSLNTVTPPEENPLGNFKRNMNEIYGNRNHNLESSSQNVLQDLDMLPSEITLDDLEVTNNSDDKMLGYTFFGPVPYFIPTRCLICDSSANYAHSCLQRMENPTPSVQEMEFFNISGHRMVCSKGDFTPHYDTLQINGQLVSTLKFVQRPRRGTEVFVKNIPRDVFLQDILELVIACGDVYQIRLLMDFSGYNRGYCFVTYLHKDSARKAVVTLNGSTLKSSTVVVKLSFDNNKLEMRGIPPEIDRNEIFRSVMELGIGLVQVLTFRSNANAGNVCVLKYNSHRNALEARKRMWPRIVLWGRAVEVDWAVPHEVLNSKRLYFRNVPADATKSQLYDEVTKYVKPEALLNMFLRDNLGYFLFINESVAIGAFNMLRQVQICGRILEFSFSRFIPNSLQLDLLMSLHALMLLFLLGTNSDLLGRLSSISGGKFTLALGTGSEGDCSLLGSISYVQQAPPLPMPPILELLLLSRLSSVWGATVLAPSEPELLELRRSIVEV